MRLTRIHIENFRSIRALDLELCDSTVLIGPNNAGKTAILDAVRIALTRRWGQRGTGFTEYDVHLARENDNPKESPGISIELHAEEQTTGDWPDAVQQDLDAIIQSDPVTGKSFITLRASCVWNEAEACFQPSFSFLNAARAPMIGPSARHTNLERFWQYLPSFYLGALRNAEDEFSSRSQFWGRLLKAVEIPSALESRVQRVLDLLNKKLLEADPRLGQVAATLSSATRVAARDREGSVDLRLVPLKSWDLISKAEIILRNEPGWPWLPLQRQGQGVQSMSVIFLFKAFIDLLLSEFYEADSAPFLALEEPETHLHPQAARTLWTYVSNLPGQKLVTTHSPYFVQNVPFRDLRLVRLTNDGTEVRWLPPDFSAQLPHVADLDPLIEGSGGLLEYRNGAQTLTVHGRLDEHYYRRLLACYGTHPNRTIIEGILRDLRDRSIHFISDEELMKLETFARRIRGDIFFASRWMIVEGQAEYLIVHSMARCLDYGFDEHGVSLIDAQNNGSASLFAALARALGIPWLAVFDGDEGGQACLRAIETRGFDPDFIAQRCRLHMAGTLENQLLTDGLESELRLILQAIGLTDAATIDRPTLLKRLDDDKYKIRYAVELVARLDGNPDLARRMPQAFRDAITDLRGLT